MARPALLAALLMACACAAAAQAPATEAPSQTPITEALLQQTGIIPDVISGVSLDPKLYFSISFAAGDVDAGNMFTINQTMAAPMVKVSCKPGACTVPRRTYYTLIMADPDAPTPLAPSRRNIWHWGVINAPNGRIKSGTAITTYNGPMPPMGIHRYVLLLFKQQGTYSAPMTPDDGRSNFDVNAFAARHNLGLPVAVNWFTVQPDAAP